MSFFETPQTSLAGKVAIVTGGNIGLGYQSSLVLAGYGAKVVIACRDVEKGQAAAQKINQQFPNATLQTLALDLTSHLSIENFSQVFASTHCRLDILINNAGVVNLEQLTHTKDGHEMHMATNHFGHFALTGRLLPLIAASDAARVVTVSSSAHRFGTIDFSDLDWRARPYHRMQAYGDSKLANLLFTSKLASYFHSHGINAISLGAHPGLTATERQQSIGIGGLFTHWLASPSTKGVRSQVYAAIHPDADPNLFYGPRFGIMGPVHGRPDLIPNLDANLADRLWKLSETVTKISYDEQTLTS